MSAVGASIVGFLDRTGEFTWMALRTSVAPLRRQRRVRVAIQQVYRQGVRALALATVTALFYGMVMALQLGSGLHRFAATSLLAQVTTLGLLRELVPVMVGLVIGVRLSAGIAAELGAMAVTQQIDAARMLGADPVVELVAPRVFAAALTLPLLTAYTDIVASFGAMIIAHVEYRQGARYYFTGSHQFAGAGDFLSGILKAATFGVTISLAACWFGMRATGGSQGVGRAATRAVVASTLSVILLDFFISRLTGRW